MPKIDHHEVGRLVTVWVVATVIHAVVFGLLVWGSCPVVVANMCGFIAGLMVSYQGQERWALRRPPRDMFRFPLMALVGLVAHLLVMPLLLWSGLGPWGAWWVLIATVPSVAGWTARLWSLEASRAL